MKKFQFTLETLRVFREAKLKEQEQHLASAVTAYNIKQKALRANREASERTWKNLNEEPRKVFSDYLYLDRLEKQGKEMHGEMHEAHLTMEEEQKHYTVMRRDLRVVEKLRERQYREYKQKEERVKDEAIAEISRARKFMKSWNLARQVK
ncbi:MAG: hypothetical protein AAF975_02785 [Spirochaetota bacterium]